MNTRIGPGHNAPGSVFVPDIFFQKQFSTCRVSAVRSWQSGQNAFSTNCQCSIFRNERRSGVVSLLLFIIVCFGAFVCVCVCILLVFLASFSLPAHSHRHMSAAAKTFSRILLFSVVVVAVFASFASFQCRFDVSEIFPTTMTIKTARVRFRTLPT